MMCLRRVMLMLVALILFLYATPLFPQNGNGYRYDFGGTRAFDIVQEGPYTIKVRYSVSELTVVPAESRHGRFFILEIPGHHSVSDPGKPELPVISTLLSLPDATSYKIEYTNIRSVEIKPGEKGMQGQMRPAQPGRTKSLQQDPEPFIIDTEVYRKNAFSKNDTLIIEQTGTLRGNNLATLSFIPARYNPVKNLISIIVEADITVTIIPSAKSVTPGSANITALNQEPEEKGIKSFSPEQLINGYTDKPAGLVILSDTAYRKQLEPLIRWKTQKGFNVTAVYRGATLAGTTFVQLKDTLRKIYNAADENGLAPPDYLLIIGDLNTIPKSDGTSNLSDMYYGEFTGDGDFIPEMYIGRIPVRDTADVTSVVNKILTYERQEFADTNTFYYNTLVTAGNDAGYATFMNGQVNYASGVYLNTGNGFNATSFIHPQSASMDDSVKVLLNKGLGFLNYTGHGNINKWDDPTFTNTDAESLTNKDMYPFIVSNACLTGQFSSSTNLANALVLARDKGAIGFIGCTNDSYWTEDYYYAVGAGQVTLNPVYTTGVLGFYDRFFHTHEELPSQWYYTMGQVNFAGLMAVSASTTSRKKYYWETYSLIGDPSVIPVIGKQDSILTNLPDTLPTGLGSLYITAPPFTYAAVSDGITLWDAATVSPSGYVSLNLPEIKGDSCMVVITGQGWKPLIKTIFFSESDGSWLNASLFTINDSDGNDNGKADYGETIYLGLSLENLGNQPSVDAYAKISSESDWVTILNDSAFIGSIPAKGNLYFDKAFTLRISNSVPDKGMISFTITVTENNTARVYLHDLVIQAPEMSILSMRFDDTEEGNSNMLPDRGETLDLVFAVLNSGSSSSEGVFRITNLPDGIELDNLSVQTGIIPAGETIEIRIRASVASTSQPGKKIIIESMIDCGNYTGYRTFEISVGRTRESFEYGNFNLFPWINTSTVPWVITSTVSYDGTMSARSGEISGNGVTTLQINLDLPEQDTLKFWYKVSSESGYDFFRFSINGTELFRDSGEKDWMERVEILQAGAHLVEWSYTKDGSVSAGLDRAWLDMIDFPKAAFATRDLEISALINPDIKEEYNDDEDVTVRVKNMGNGTINGFYLAYSVNNQALHEWQYFDFPIPYRDSVTVTFDKKADLAKYGIYDIVVYSFNNDDDFAMNDTIKVRIENTRIRSEARAFPNPFADYLNIFISSETSENVIITITEVTGRRHYSSEFFLEEGDNRLTIPAGELTPGVYVITVKGPLTSRKLKVVKL